MEKRISPCPISNPKRKILGRPSLKVFGKKLAEARLRAGLTQSALGRQVNVGPGRIGKIEQADIEGIDPSRVGSYAIALKMTEQQFRTEIAVPNGHMADVKSAPPEPPPVALSPQQQQIIRDLAAAADLEPSEMLDRILADAQRKYRSARKLQGN